MNIIGKSNGILKSVQGTHKIGKKSKTHNKSNKMTDIIEIIYIVSSNHNVIKLEIS